MSLNLQSVSNKTLIKERIAMVKGLSYHENFLSNEEQIDLYRVLAGLNYKLINGKPTIYFGVDYTHRKKVHDKELKDIPHFFNLLQPLDLNYDQLEIQYYRKDDGHNLLKESDIFQNNTIVIPIGSHFVYDFNKNDDWVSFLMQPGCLLLLGDKSNTWDRRINKRVKEKFNNYSIYRKPFYLLTFRNIK